MMTIERIFGPYVHQELSRPHSDPEIRKMEEQMLDIQMKFIANAYRKPTYEEVFDLLPAHYKRIKI